MFCNDTMYCDLRHCRHHQIQRDHDGRASIHWSRVRPHRYPRAGRGDVCILFPRSIGAGLYDATSACQRTGFLPGFGQEAPRIASIVPLVGVGFGV
jgi:hypothetical protein